MESPHVGMAWGIPISLLMNAFWRAVLGFGLCCALGIAEAGARDGEAALTRSQAYQRAAQLEALGRKLFADPSLSASGRMACATCHDPDRAFGPANALPVQLGGKDL